MSPLIASANLASANNTLRAKVYVGTSSDTRVIELSRLLSCLSREEKLSALHMVSKRLVTKAASVMRKLVGTLPGLARGEVRDPW